MALVVVGCVVTATWLQRPVAEPAPPLPLSPPPPPAASAPAQLVVSVVGKVERPGLVTVPAGSRVADALDAAGGPLPDTDVTALNLARRLVDGEQLYVAVPAPAQAAGQSGGGAGDGKVDLNTATEEQFDALPGIGEVTARRIVQWRTEHGRFDSVDQLREVGGIGESRFARLRELVRV
ncbi:ComEA family DNA-binding protein [Saccharopolyspora rosea]|uniref:Helix-hairpin-helix domain-containing protein n=1 Tax=Saccharopolyspora rosea TaxID=524884 RepID=A0ABW3FUQ6_9PSEU|nr:ComEA family DNA-binding protein [Saccharopolyspora rosea]